MKIDDMEKSVRLLGYNQVGLNDVASGITEDRWRDIIVVAANHKEAKAFWDKVTRLLLSSWLDSRHFTITLVSQKHGRTRIWVVSIDETLDKLRGLDRNLTAVVLLPQ